MNELVPTKIVEITKNVVITDNIDRLVAIAKKEIADLKIDQMEVSEENKQKIKDVRTTLNKKLTAYETDRKAIKKLVMQPVEQFEEIYNERLKKVFDTEIKKLDEKITSIEEGQIKKFEDYGLDYFNKKLEITPLKFANTFKDVGLKINLSINNKKIRDAIDKHFEKIESAITIIETHEHSSRLEVLWKKNDYDIGIALVKLSTALSEEKAVERRNEEVRIVEGTGLSTGIVGSIQRLRSTVVEPVVVEPVMSTEPEEVFEFDLKITLSERNLKNLTEFMDKSGILYELLGDE